MLLSLSKATEHRAVPRTGGMAVLARTHYALAFWSARLPRRFSIRFGRRLAALESPMSESPDKLVVISDLCVRCGRGPIECVRRNGRALCRHRVEHRPRRRCIHPGAHANGNGRVMQNLLATYLCLPAPQRLLDARRRRFNTIIFSAPVGKRDAPARFAGERPLPQFPPWNAETLPSGRAHAATYFETRRRNAIHFNGRVEGRGAPSSSCRS